MTPRHILMLLVLLATLTSTTGCGDEESPAAPTGGGATTINSILPPGASSGIQITISGSNFGNDQGAGSVQVGGKDATIDSWKDTEITCTMPGGLSQSLGVGVTLVTNSGKVASTKMDITPPHTYQVTSHHAMDHYPCWSPGGDWIYFSSTRSGGANWDIYRIPATGGVAERVTYDERPDFYPDVRPSSGELAWSSQMKLINNSEGDYEIFHGFPKCIGPGSACSVTMLTDNQSRDLDPAWANTVYAGYSMAYTYEEVDQSGHFVAWKIMLDAGGGPVELTQGRQPNFSSNGRWVVYTYQDNVYKIPTDGGAPVQLTNGNTDFYPHWGWANDKIVFERSNGGNFQDIFVMNADGTGVEALVSTPNTEQCPTWSPDCSKIAYYANVVGRFDIYVYVVP
jgi:Tol biopolymer transport system component